MTAQALYRHYDVDGALLYVGISNHIGRRTDDHARHSAWFGSIAKIDITQYPDREAALAAERAAIKAEKPRYNIHHQAKLPPLPPVDASREGIKRAVVLRPLYDIAKAAEMLGVSTHLVRGEIVKGALGSIELTGPRAKHSKTYVTGWQIIDWLEAHS